MSEIIRIRDLAREYQMGEERILALRSVTLGTEPGPGKPVVREFRLTVCYVFATKNSEPEHLFRGQLRFETRGKILSGGFRQEILITALHPVVDLDPPWF